MEFSFFNSCVMAVRCLPRLYKCFFFSLLLLSLFVVATLVALNSPQAMIYGFVGALLAIFQTCVVIDAICHFKEQTRWSLKKRLPRIIKSFASILLVIFIVGSSVYLLSLLLGWVLLFLPKTTPYHNIIAAIASVSLLGLPFLYFTVNLLMVPYCLINRGDRLRESVKFSLQLVLPHWLSAMIIYAMFLIFVLIFSPSSILLTQYLHPKFTLLASWAILSIILPVLVFIWYDFIMFLQDALKERLRRAKAHHQ
jgi:hypothetical protein